MMKYRRPISTLLSVPSPIPSISNSARKSIIASTRLCFVSGTLLVTTTFDLTYLNQILIIVPTHYIFSLLGKTEHTCYRQPNEIRTRS